MATAKNPAATRAATCPASIGSPSRLARRSLRRTLSRDAIRPGALRGGAVAAGHGAIPAEGLAHARGAVCPAGLRAVPGRLVVPAAPGRNGRVLLPDDPLGEVVRVQVALAVPEPRRARVARVAQVHGDGPGPPA